MYAQACFISFALTTALLSLCCSCLAASNCASPISCSPPPPPPKIHFQLVSAPSNQKQLEIFLLIFILHGVDIGFILLSVQVLLSSRTVPDITVERVFLEGHCKQGEPDGSTRPACFFFSFLPFSPPSARRCKGIWVQAVWGWQQRGVESRGVLFKKIKKKKQCCLIG